MILAPLCPKPPDAPFEGKVENFPTAHPVREKSDCNIDWQPVSLQCPSFESIHVTSAIYGREKQTRDLCNGDEDSKRVSVDCLEDLTVVYLDYCQGKYNCTFPILPSVHDFSGECLAGQKNQLEISYICGKTLILLYP